MTDQIIHPGRSSAAFVARSGPEFDRPPGDGAFDAVAGLLAACLDVDAVIVDIVDVDGAWQPHQTVRPVRPAGLSVAWRAADAEQPQDAAEVRALADPIVARERGFPYYAGMPLRSHDGCRLGTLVALDRAMRDPSDQDLLRLREAAAIIADMLDLRLDGFRRLGAPEAKRSRAL